MQKALIQQGFEACHKLIRRIYHRATNQGGGRRSKSPLLQIFQHLFRKMWANTRLDFETRQTGNVHWRSLKVYLSEGTFAKIDQQYAAKFPNQNTEQYVKRWVKPLFRRHGKTVKSSLLNSWKHF